MNSEVHPAVAALVLFMTAVAIALWMWASGVAGGCGGPAELSTSPNGHHFVQIQDYLVEHDGNGGYLRTHDLQEIGVDVLLGGHAFFANGDILLRRGPDPRSVLDNIRAYKRETNRNSILPADDQSGLFRCDLYEKTCERFGEEGVDFKAAISIFVEHPSDTVFISDTTRHLLRKYSPDGVELAAPAKGFKFPNDLMVYDDVLLIADTNNHLIKHVSPETNGYGEHISSSPVVPKVARDSQRRWPSHFARVGDEWWVNNMQTGMNNGGLYVFDEEWQFTHRIELPGNADPISILPVGDSVWVSDWNNDVVRRFSIDGTPQSDLESEGLEEILEVSRQQRRLYTILSYSGFAALAAIFGILIVRAITNNTPQQRAEREGESVARDELSEPLYLEPDPKRRRRTTLLAWLIGTLMVLGFGGLIFGIGISEKPEALRLLALPFGGLCVVVVLMLWIDRANWNTSVAVDGNTVTLTDHTGRQSHCPVQQVRYNDTAIATRDSLVMLGMPNARIYSKADLENRLLPRLKEAQKVGAFEMLKLQIQMRHPQGIFLLLLIAALIGYVVVKYLY